MTFRRFTGLCLLWLITGWLWLVVVAPATAGTHGWLTGADAVWVDIQGEATAESARRALATSSLDRAPPFSRAPVWLRFSIPADRNDSSEWILSNENPIVATTDVYLFDAHGQLQQSQMLGRLAAKPESSHLQRQQAWLRLQPGQPYELLVKLESSTPLTVAMRWVPEADLSTYNQRRYARYWVMLSVALAMFLFNAVLLLGRRDAAYGWFMAFHGVVVFYFAGLSGYGYLFMPALVVQWIADQILTFNFLLLFLLFRFSMSYLSQPETQSIRLSNGLSKAIPVVLFIGALISLVVDDLVLFGPYMGAQLLTFLPIFWLCWRHAQSGYTPAWLILASIVIQLAGGTLGTLAYMGLVAPNLWLLNAFFVSTVVELLLMSFAVVVRMRFLEARQQAQMLRDSDTGLPNLLYLDRVLDKQWPVLSRRLKHPMIVMIELSGFKSALQLMGPSLSQRLWIQAVTDWNETLLEYPWAVPLPHFERPASVLIWSRTALLLVADCSEPAKLERDLSSMRWRSLDIEEQNHELEARLAAYPVGDYEISLDEALRKLSVAQVTGAQQRRFFQIYEPAQDAFFNRQNQLIRALHRAIERDQLCCYVQPILDLHSDSIVGGEVLLRWQHEHFGWVSPAEFIPLAEQMDWMSDITLWVFSEVANWQQRATRVLPLSVNLSVLDLEIDKDRQDLPQALQALNLDLTQLKVEVTETVLMKEPEDCVRSLNRLRQLGCQVSIDDFGTGYSSLAYLSRTQPDEVKIDRAFIKSLAVSAIDRRIVSAIVQLARGIGAQVVAEGVEDASCLKDCVQLGIDRAQGFGIARPMPLAEFECWLSDYQRFTSGSLLNELSDPVNSSSAPGKPDSEN